MAKVIICESMVKPREIPVASKSKGDGRYWMVTSPTLFNDAICDCPGYEFRGKCRHIEAVVANRCIYHQPLLLDDGFFVQGVCPSCGDKLILFELDPEF